MTKGELQRSLLYECRCDERLKGKDEGSIDCVTGTGTPKNTDQGSLSSFFMGIDGFDS